jgi:hypothetical protein
MGHKTVSDDVVLTSVVYHGVTSSFFGIGILPVSDVTGRLVFRSVLLVWRELLFSAKGGLAVSKRGLVPPFSLKKGANAPFLREKGVPAKKMIPKCTDRDFHTNNVSLLGSPFAKKSHTR